MIKYVKGDLFKATEDIIAHGCNCRGGFGSGVAGIMAKKHPKAKESYLNKHMTEGWKLGDIQVLESNGKFIANCATQDKYGNGRFDERFADYKAIEVCMLKLYKYCKMMNYTLAIPKIGAGLAGGDWTIIEPIINEVFEDMDVTVYYL